VRICFSVDNYDRAGGGAALAVRELAQYLAARGHAVDVLQPGVHADYTDGSVRVHQRPLRRSYLMRQHDRDTLGWNRQWHRVVDHYLAATPTDVLFTQNRLLYSSVEAASAHGVPSVVWAHAYRIFCADQFMSHDPLKHCSAACRDCEHGVFRAAIADNRAAYRHGLERASLVLANSLYMQRVIRNLSGIEAPVIYPTFGLARWFQPGARERRQVLFVKPIERKGLGLFVEIARRLPDTRFVVAGHLSRHSGTVLKALDNVTCPGWIDDMAGVYAESRLLLGPSRWPEPFGRVFVEAAAAGVPSLASNRGGAPEAVGSGGLLLDDLDDADCWVEAMCSLDDPDRYAEISQRARAHARSFAAETVGPELEAAIRDATGLPFDLADAASA
jgi:glycosyltransferase involved in cell wall biosynthesis